MGTSNDRLRELNELRQQRALSAEEWREVAVLSTEIGHRQQAAKAIRRARELEGRAADLATPPVAKPLASPGGRCPSCQTPVRVRYAWLPLRLRCPRCGHEAWPSAFLPAKSAPRHQPTEEELTVKMMEQTRTLGSLALKLRVAEATAGIVLWGGCLTYLVVATIVGIIASLFGLGK